MNTSVSDRLTPRKLRKTKHPGEVSGVLAFGQPASVRPASAARNPADGLHQRGHALGHAFEALITLGL